MMDIKAGALNGLKRAIEIFQKDIQSLSDEALVARFGPKTRTVADIVFEVNLVNDHIGMSVRGEEPFPWPDGGWITAPADFCTKEVILAAFERSAERIVSTFESLSEEELEAPMSTEHGETNAFERCRFVAVHLWYHSGQINYIQTMLGDDDWHW